MIHESDEENDSDDDSGDAHHHLQNCCNFMTIMLFLVDMSLPML